MDMHLAGMPLIGVTGGHLIGTHLQARISRRRASHRRVPQLHPNRTSHSARLRCCVAWGGVMRYPQMVPGRDPSTSARGPSTSARGPSSSARGPSSAARGPSSSARGLPTFFPRSSAFGCRVSVLPCALGLATWELCLRRIQKNLLLDAPLFSAFSTLRHSLSSASGIPNHFPTGAPLLMGEVSWIKSSLE
jgi:hypothetical protein